MSCKVAQYLPQGEGPDPEVERVIHSGKRIVGALRLTVRRRPGIRFRPKETFELQVESDQGDDLVLKAYKEGREMIAELHQGSTKIRALHTHEGHLNPDCREPLPNGHMHFPTDQNPLSTGASSFAYEIPCSNEESLVFFVALFSALLDIELGPFQITLDSAT